MIYNDGEQLHIPGIDVTPDKPVEVQEQSSIPFKLLDPSLTDSKVVLANALLENQPLFSLSASKLRDVLISSLPSFKPDSSIDDIKAAMRDNSFLQLKVTDIASAADWDNKNAYKIVKDALSELRDTPYTFEYTTKDGKKGVFSASLVSAFDYQFGCGRANIELSRAFAPYLIFLRNKYTLWKLEYSYAFKNVTHKRLYERLAQYRSVGRRSFPVLELKSQVGLANKYKGNLYNLKKKFLDPAIHEISSCTDLHVFYDVQGRGDSAVINFTFYQKDVPPKVPKSAEKHGPVSPADLALLVELATNETPIRNVTTEDDKLRSLCEYALSFFDYNDSECVNDAFSCISTAANEYVQRSMETDISKPIPYFRAILKNECNGLCLQRAYLSSK